MSEIDYNYGELKIARTAGDPRRIMPALSSILESGCGIEQTVMDAELKRETFVCGPDIDAEIVLFGNKLTKEIHFVCSRGEKLPFRASSVEDVIARVSLLSMDIPSVVPEVARVLKLGGSFWVRLHPLSMLRERFFSAIRSCSLRNLLYATYILMNGISFQRTGNMFRYPLNWKRCESVRTIGGITRPMKRSGFEQLQIECSHFFDVRAHKRHSSRLTELGKKTPCAASAV